MRPMTPMTRRIAWLAGAALLAVSLGSAYVHAQNTSGGPGPGMGRRGGPGGGPFGPGGPGGPGGMFGPMLMQRLNLTEAQREQVKSVLDSHRDEMKALADRSFAARRGVQAAVTAEQFDESAVRARSAEVAAVDADMAVLQARVHAEVWRLLTPEQQKEAAALQARMDQRRDAGPGRRGERRGERGAR